MFRQLSICQYGQPNRPCPTHSTVENPVRRIQFGEPTTQYMLTQPAFPSTPPRSSGGSGHRLSGGSARRHSRSPATSEDGKHRRHSRRLSFLKPHKEHRKERIIIVDAPPTPRTPPQAYPQTFTAPSSPNPLLRSPRRQPIIVDERAFFPRVRAPSVGAGLGDHPRHRSSSRPRHGWESASTSHTSFDLRAEREREERDRHERHRHEEREREMDSEIRLARLIAQQDAEIRSRPAVPIAPRPLGQRPYLRPVVDQSQALQSMMNGLSLSNRVGERALVEAAADRRRREQKEKAVKQHLAAAEEEAQRQRLRERQMPRRRFSVGPGHRRHRVLYDDGVYRWE